MPTLTSGNAMPNWRRALAGSLALRWVLSIAVLVGLGISALLAITYTEMNSQVASQGATVRQLARQRMAERISSEIELAAQRLRDQLVNLERSLLSIADQRSTIAAVQGRNDVSIAEVIGKRVLLSGMSGAIVIDQDRHVIGSERTGAELVMADDALRNHDIYTSIANLLADNDRSAPRVFRHLGTLDASFSSILLAPVQDRYGAVLGVPVFDDFGEPVAIILAYRLLRAEEPVLADFARTTGSRVALMSDGSVISAAGADISAIAFRSPAADGLQAIPELQASGLCKTAMPRLQLCVIRPDSEIDQIGTGILDLGHKQLRQTQRMLLVAGTVAIAAITLVVIFLARQLVRPLSEITRAVNDVALGEWRVEVRHVGRPDEIGQIARAVSAMQVSLIERDRMRQELVRIDAINQRRLVLDSAVANFEEGMVVVMKNINDTVHALSDTNEVLDAAARQADAQAERIRNTTMASASRASNASHSTLALSRTNREIGEKIRHTSEVVHQSGDHVRAAEAKLSEMSDVTQQVESAIGELQRHLADLGTMSLQVSLEALSASERGGSSAQLARSIEGVAGRTADAVAVIAREFGRLAAITDSATGEIGEVKGVLGAALRETSEIAVAVAEQDAAAREIAEGLSNSAQAMVTLADSVDQLRTNMNAAHEASNEFILAARRIVDDAKSIDGSIRSFVKEVNA
ncbi:MAG TPA: methyl-accepting chemotaxis protein [Rhabdaerophilum sp.]|nr:methyl-accepting chemotaxis protein [Rhabdaerophilum sp.]